MRRDAERSRSFRAADAITAYVEQEAWQVREIHAAIDELEAGRRVDHEKVASWLKSWGMAKEKNAPR